MTTAPLQTVRVGAGCELVSDRELYEIFRPFGMTLTGFRALLRSLGVPAIVMPNGVRLVDRFTFTMGVKAATRFGADKSFVVPGHPWIPDKVAHNLYRLKLDPLDFSNDGQDIVHHMMASLHHDFKSPSPRTQAILHDIADLIRARLSRAVEAVEQQVLNRGAVELRKAMNGGQPQPTTAAE